ncbi:MAG: hypothetical protein LBJ00_00260 [Planctomycetaceae bacterium]|nr:hypothetical protein [Planctomycetaceae bacterium]
MKRLFKGEAYRPYRLRYKQMLCVAAIAVFGFWNFKTSTITATILKYDTVKKIKFLYLLSFY